MVKRISCRVIEPASANVTSNTVPIPPRPRQVTAIVPVPIPAEIPVELSPTGLYVDFLA